MKKRQIFLNLGLIILCAIIVYPFLMLLSVSFSAEKDIAMYGYKLIPKHIDLEAYKYVFSNPTSIINAYKITFIFSFVAMVMSVLFDAMIAYPLSRRNMKGKSGLSFYLYFTMLFSGGLVPLYILITQYLHMGDTIWVYILPGMISPWYVFMMRTFFSELPHEIFESVQIDGGNEYIIFFRFVLPMSKPVLATVALLTFLAKWNCWQESMLYINSSEKYSLQYLLQMMMSNIELLQSNKNATTLIDVSQIPSETARMAMAIVATGPALVVFPFFQKYFVKGLTVGSVKG